jgi:hypothetical protein
MYVKARIISVETVPGIRWWWIRAVKGGESKYDILDTSKNICK